MAATPQPTRGLVYTFYSYKGGVGRSMALANVAALLARWGQKVLVLDWDLEAPGIERFFERWLRGPGRKDTRGLVDLVEAFAQGEPIPWADALLRAHLSPASQIHILSAGRDDGGYTARLQKIEWEPLFAEKKFGLYLEKLREEWVLAYDFILIDSRTGITDIGGICTIHLPDVVIPLFTANAQSLAGVKDVMLRARSAHADLPLDRDRLLVVPIPARDESNSEYETAKKWRERFALELAEFFRDWAPDGEKPYDILDRLKIPYFAYWSFGEQLPVMDEDPENPKTLAFSYQLIARLLLAKLDWNEAKQGTAATEAAAVQNVKAAELTLEAARRRTEAHREAAERETTALSERRERYLETRFKREVENLRNYLVFSQKSLEHLTQRVTYGGALAITGAVGGIFTIRFADAAYATYGWIVGTIGVLGTASVAWALAHRKHWMQQRHSLEAINRALERERVFFEGSAGPYRGLDASAALDRFIAAAETIIGATDRAQNAAEVDSIIEKLHAEPISPPLPTASVPATTSTLPATPSLESVAPAESVVAKGPASLSPIEADPAEPYDIFISYRMNPITSAWLQEFIPLLTSWMASLLGSAPRVFFDSTELAAGDQFLPQTDRALTSSRCLLVILTPAYAKSPFCMHELETFAARPDPAIVPILVQNTEPLPDLLRSIRYRDLRDYYFVGGGFTQSALYVDFQKQVRNLAEEIVVLLGRDRSPATQPSS